MQKKSTLKKILPLFARTFLSFFVLCVFFNTSLAQKRSSKPVTTQSDENRKQAEAINTANASASFSDAVKSQAAVPVKAATVIPPITNPEKKKDAAAKPAANTKKNKQQ